MRKVLLSFDIEEFDLPLAYGKPLAFEEQINISAAGAKIILDILLENQIQATFFSTVVFASHTTNLIHRIISEGHELASHGYYHSAFKCEHLSQSKAELEKISGASVRGFRMPRMMPVDNDEIQKAGYLYNTSLNPVYLPGCYNNFSKPRALFKANGVVQLPASVTPVIRFPLFWLSFHNVPLWFYKTACVHTIIRDNYLNIYFHPWEFTDLKESKYGLPGYVSRNSGTKMIKRFSHLIAWMKEKDYSFSTVIEYIASS